MAKLGTLVMCSNVKWWHCPQGMIAWASQGPRGHDAGGWHPSGDTLQLFAASTFCSYTLPTAKYETLLASTFLGKKNPKQEVLVEEREQLGMQEAVEHCWDLASGGDSRRPLPPVSNRLSLASPGLPRTWELQDSFLSPTSVSVLLTQCVWRKKHSFLSSFYNHLI